MSLTCNLDDDQLPLKTKQFISQLIGEKINGKFVVNGDKGDFLDKTEFSIVNGVSEKEEKENMRALRKLQYTLGLSQSPDVSNEVFYGVHIPLDARLQSAEGRY